MNEFFSNLRIFHLIFLLGLCGLLINCSNEDEPSRSSFATPVLTVDNNKVSCTRCTDFGNFIENNGNQIFIGGYSSISILNYENGQMELVQQLEDLGESGLWDFWVNDEWLFVGAADPYGTGLLRIYQFNGTEWNITQSIGTGRVEDNFGSSIDMDNDVLVVGASALWSDNLGGSNADEGRVYVLVRTGNQWEVQEEIISNLSSPNDHFGAEVAIQNGIILAGSGRSPLHIFRYDGTLELLRIDTLTQTTAIEHDQDHFLMKTVNPGGVRAFDLTGEGAFNRYPINADFGDLQVTDFGDVFAIKDTSAVVAFWQENTGYLLSFENNAWEFVSAIDTEEETLLFEYKGLDFVGQKVIVGGTAQAEQSVVYLLDR